MIVPDVNVLVGAFHQDAVAHEQHARWLRELLNGPTEIGLVDLVLVGFVRIVTHRRIFADAAPTDVALEFVERLRSAPRARHLPSTAAVYDRFRALASVDTQVRGNLVPDAWIAAIALAHGARVATRDRGFARYEVEQELLQ